MSVLMRRSVLVLAVLFGILFAVVMVAFEALEGPMWAVPFVAACIVGLQYLLSPWLIQLLFKIRWVPLDELGPEISRFVKETCQRLRIAIPRFGIIEDGNPNAFTFGHHAGNARVVITRGLLQMLDAEEVKAVIGHELGHVKNRDFIVMTLAAAVPIVLYAIYRATLYSRGRRGRGSAYLILVGVGAFLAYVVSHFIVLLLSRIREYFADERSAEATHNPNALARALVKIAYGLARGHEAERRETVPKMELARPLGIFDPKMARSLALASAQTAGGLDPSTVAEAMKWDLWNPWATVWELSSTHPLPAKRIKRLEKIALYLGQSPEFQALFDEKPESYYDEFAVDLFVASLPHLLLLVGLGAGIWASLHTGNPLLAVGLPVTGLGLGLTARLAFSYPKPFRKRTVESLVKEVKVSGIRAVPCVLEGKVIGRGVPGLHWSEDLVLHDGTGFVVLDYRQPWALWEFLFGLIRAKKLVGRRLRAFGWYRRDPRPRVELSHAVDLDTGERLRCYVYIFKKVGAAFLLGAGLLLLFLGLFGL